MLKLTPLLAALLLAGCAAGASKKPTRAASVTVGETPGWHRTATSTDVIRISQIPDTFASVIEEAKRAGFAKHIAAEGRILAPAATVARPTPTPGSYMCRGMDIGARTKRTKAFTAYKPFFCHIGVSGDDLALTKQTGNQRPTGYLFDNEDNHRLVFLGSMVSGNEKNTPAYRENPSKDLVGVFERVGPMKFRLILLTPESSSSKIQVFEFVPAPVQLDED